MNRFDPLAENGWLRLLAESRPEERPSEGRRDPCPGVGEWAALYDGTVDSRSRVRLVGHLSRCDLCALLWSHLVDVESVGFRATGPRPPVREGGPERLRSSTGDARAGTIGPEARRRRARVWVATAAVLALLGLAVPFLLTPVPSPDTVRGPEAVPRFDVEIGTSGGGGAVALSWDPWPDAEGYRVRMWDRTGSLVLEVTLPADRRELVPRLEDRGPGERLIAVVEALEAGRVVATGDLVEFPVSGAADPEAGGARDGRRRGEGR